MPDTVPCPAASVWCAPMTSGTEPAVDEDDKPSVGFRAAGHPFGAIGTLGGDSFSDGATTYTVTELVSGGAGELHLDTDPDLPANGAGPTLHVQRLTGALRPVPLSATDAPPYGDQDNWYFGQLVGTGPNNPPLLRTVRRLNGRYAFSTDAGTGLMVRLAIGLGRSEARIC